MQAIPRTNSFSFLNKGITRASFQASKASRTEALMTAVKVFVIIAALSDEEEWKFFMSKTNNHGRSNEPMNPLGTRIHRQFIWSTIICVRVNRKSFLQLAIWASWSKNLLPQTSFQLQSTPFIADLELVSSLARVHNSGSLFQSNVCNLFLPGI